MEPTLQNLLCSNRSRSYVSLLRRYGFLAPKPSEQDEEPSCPKRAPCKKEAKQSFWRGLLGKKKPEAAASKPPIETCQKHQDECKPDPDLSQYGGQAFKTCGSAYIVQSDGVPTEDCVLSREDKILKMIEANLGLKSKAEDPMPAFTTVGQRMMDLNERRLHPLYRVYRNVPKRTMLALPQRPTYTTRSGPIDPSDMPLQFRFNSELLDKKNMFADYKRVEPPQQLAARIVELKRNEKPTVHKKMPVIPIDAEAPTAPRKQTVYETLYQNDTKF